MRPTESTRRRPLDQTQPRWLTTLAGLLLLLLLITPEPVQARSLAAVADSLRQDIRRSQSRLTQETADIAKRSDALAADIAKESAGLKSLRDRAAVARRQADERTVTLETLESRIQTWRNQDRYRTNLIDDFVGRQPNIFANSVPGKDDANDANAATDGPSDETVRALTAALAGIEAAMAPRFAAVEVITEDGAIQTADRLKLGPSQWFLTDKAAGLLVREDASGLRMAHAFAEPEAAALESVRAGARAALPLDPTIDRLLTSRVSPPGFLEHLQMGGIWIVPILSFALLATLIGIAKTVQFARLPKLQPVLPNSGRPANLNSLKGAQREIVEIAQSARSSEERDDLLFAFLTAQRSRLERFLGAIAVTATVSPLLGLLGTVSGMISTFNMMTLFGAGDPAIVSGGISEALVTTELGLIVAIPALILHALLTRKATSYAQGLESSAIALSQSSGSAGEASPT